MAVAAAAVAAVAVVVVAAGGGGGVEDPVDRVVAAAGAATVPLTAMLHHRHSMIPCAPASPGPPRCLATSGARRASKAWRASLRARLSASTVQNRSTPHRPWH